MTGDFLSQTWLKCIISRVLYKYNGLIIHLESHHERRHDEINKMR